MKRKYRQDNSNDMIENPALLQLICDVKEKIILDLECGDTQLRTELFQKECATYIGIQNRNNLSSEIVSILNSRKCHIIFLYFYTSYVIL